MWCRAHERESLKGAGTFHQIQLHLGAGEAGLDGSPMGPGPPKTAQEAGLEWDPSPSSASC